jgi:hypothetical protein
MDLGDADHAPLARLLLLITKAAASSRGQAGGGQPPGRPVPFAAGGRKLIVRAARNLLPLLRAIKRHVRRAASEEE